MRALVLAAGKGTRLGSASGGMPKPLTDVGGTTALEHVLRWISDEPLDRIWINVHEHGEVVRSHIGDRIGGIPIAYSHEPELLGTAGAWKKLEREWTTTSLVIYGDNLMHFDLGALRSSHERNGALVTIAVFDPDRHANTGPGGGRVEMEDQRITRFVEGGAAGLINAGAYLVEPELAARLPGGFLDFGHDVLPALAESGELAGHVVERGAYCLGVDTPERLMRARQMLATQQERAG
jgi:mannose-1-phosphate guanylyltransferase